MPSSSEIALFFGAGRMIGQEVVKNFLAKGYKVVVGSRNAEEGYNSDMKVYHLKVDLSDPLAVAPFFAKVKEQFGVPTVVVFNDPKNPLGSLSISTVEQEFKVNVLSVLAAAQEAVKCFDVLPPEASKTFIFSGSDRNIVAPPFVMTFSMAKGANSQMINSLRLAYKDKGYKFYYTDERNAEGAAIGLDISGSAAAKLYVELAESKEQGPWQQTYVKDKGYVNFNDTDFKNFGM